MQALCVVADFLNLEQNERKNSSCKIKHNNNNNNNITNVTSSCLIFFNRSLDVFVANHVGLEYESRNDPHCELRVVGEPFAMSGASIAVKKNNPLFSKYQKLFK